MNNPVIIGILSWLLPGVGHLIQGRYKRGLIIGIDDDGICGLAGLLDPVDHHTFVIGLKKLQLGAQDPGKQHGKDGVAVQRLAQEQARRNGGDEGRGAEGYDNARNLWLGCALHGLLNAVGRAVDTLPAAGLVVARIINAAFAPQEGANFVNLCTFSPQFSKREELENVFSKSVHITGASWCAYFPLFLCLHWHFVQLCLQQRRNGL